MIWLLAPIAILLLSAGTKALDQHPVPNSAWAQLAIGGVLLIGFIVGLLIGESDD